MSLIKDVSGALYDLLPFQHSAQIFWLFPTNYKRTFTTNESKRSFNSSEIAKLAGAPEKSKSYDMHNLILGFTRKNEKYHCDPCVTFLMSVKS